MSDLITAVGDAVSEHLGVGWAGQEPQDRDNIPTGGLVIVERVGGMMTPRARSDRPWIQFTVLASSKKRAWDELRRVRQFWATPRTQVGGFFVYSIDEVSAPEDASLIVDPFYRVRVSFAFHVKGLT